MRIVCPSRNRYNIPINVALSGQKAIMSMADLISREIGESHTIIIFVQNEREFSEHRVTEKKLLLPIEIFQVHTRQTTLTLKNSEKKTNVLATHFIQMYHSCSKDIPENMDQ